MKSGKVWQRKLNFAIRLKLDNTLANIFLSLSDFCSEFASEFWLDWWFMLYQWYFIFVYLFFNWIKKGILCYAFVKLLLRKLNSLTPQILKSFLDVNNFISIPEHAMFPKLQPGSSRQSSFPSWEINNHAGMGFCVDSVQNKVKGHWHFPSLSTEVPSSHP